MHINPTVGAMILGSTLVFVLSACGARTTEVDSSADPTSSGATATPTPAESPSDSGDSASQPPDGDVPAVLDFTADTVDGAAFDGTSLAGKPAVLWFWAPWCPTCRGQIEGVSELSDKYGDKISFVGVGSLDEAPAIQDFAADVPADMAHLLDPDGAVWRHFGVIEQSTYVVLDADSKVVSEGYLEDGELAKLAGDLVS